MNKSRSPLWTVRCWLLVCFGVALTVIPAGSLVEEAGAQISEPLDSVLIVLDVSGSMNDDSGSEPGRSRLDIAKEAITGAVADVAPGSINLGLRTFAACRSDLVVPVGPANPTAFGAAVDRLSARGATGIEQALRAAVADLPTDGGNRKIILISDGEETCDGDPCAAAADLLASNIAFVVNTVGFQTAGTQAEIDLQCIAATTGGTNSPVDDLPELLKAVQGAVDDECTTSIILCYAPEVRFHPAENYFPMDPATFVRGAELDWVRSGDFFATCFGDDTINKNPSPDLLGLGVYTAHQKSVRPVWGSPPLACVNVGRAYRTNEFTRPYSDKAGNNAPRAIADGGDELDIAEGFVLPWKNYGSIDLPGEEPDGLNFDPGAGQLLNAPMYGQLGQFDDGTRYIVYHMFYGFDPKSAISFDEFVIAQLGDQLLAHEGDWERVIVVLGDDDVPTEMRFLGHGCSDAEFMSTNFVPWTSRSNETQNTQPAKLQLVDGTHPVVYVAEGSHASYSYLRNPGARACTNGGLPSGNADWTQFTDESVRWRPWESGQVLDPQQECWYGYGGAWGVGGDLDESVAIGAVLSGNPLIGGIGVSGIGGGLPFVGDLRSHDTGPAGPQWNVEGLPEGNACQRRDVRVSAPIDSGWGEPVTVSLTGIPAGTQVVVSLASVETPMATAVAAGDGSVSLNFVIPDGFGAGGHRIVVRSAATGEPIAIRHINVVPPQNCVATVFDLSIDADADSVLDICDSSVADGPFGDFDGDGVINVNDNCKRVANPSQAASGRSTAGNACSIDLGVNPAVPLIVELTGQAPLPRPAPTSSAAAEPESYEPITVAPPSPTGAYGFGTPPDVQLPESVPAASNTAVTAPAPTVAIDSVGGNEPDKEIAHTGAENRVGAMLGFLLVGSGAYVVARSRMRRRDI